MLNDLYGGGTANPVPGMASIMREVPITMHKISEVQTRQTKINKLNIWHEIPGLQKGEYLVLHMPCGIRHVNHLLITKNI